MICHNFALVMSPSDPRNKNLHSPVSVGPLVKPRTRIYIPHALFLIRIEASIRVDLDAPRLVPKDLLKAETEAVNLIVPLTPCLVPIVQLEPLDLAQKMIERLGAVSRQLWLVRALRARQVRRYKRRCTTED
jgi:hypothetical protein